MWRIITNSFLLICGLFCLYSAGRGAFLFHHWLFAIMTFGFAVALIGVALPSLFYKDEFWDLFEEHPWTRTSYALASLSFSIVCLGFVIGSWGFNSVTLFGSIGFIFFFLGVFVIKYLDYSEFKKKYIKK